MDSKSDSPTLCVGNCGFFGSPQLGNYCSVCAKKLGVSSTKNTPSGEQSQVIAGAASNSLSSSTVVPSSTAGSPVTGVESSLSSSPAPSVEQSVPTAPQKPRKEDRCASCNKKLRLALRFPCKCGDVFCREHLIPQEHNCTFDHRSAAKKTLAELNPQIKADKVPERL